jgi:hypothetical protein
LKFGRRVVVRDGLAVNRERVERQSADRGGDARKLGGPIPRVAAPQAALQPALERDGAVAVVLDLVRGQGSDVGRPEGLEGFSKAGIITVGLVSLKTSRRALIGSFEAHGRPRCL